MDKVIDILIYRFEHFPFTGDPRDYYEEIKDCETCKHEDNPFCLSCNRQDYPDWEPKEYKFIYQTGRPRSREEILKELDRLIRESIKKTKHENRTRF